MTGSLIRCWPKARWIVCSVERTNWCCKAAPTVHSSDPIAHVSKALRRRRPIQSLPESVAGTCRLAHARLGQPVRRPSDPFGFPT
jgi:hypothetical protein